MTSNSNPRFDELRWVIEIRRTLDEELEEDSEVPVNIYNVPKTLMAAKPDCYVPQEVALGPYHHWQPELYEMERYKLAAAKRTQKHLQRVKFESLVDQLNKHEPRIRACYHKFLQFNGDTLAWMMAIDASFLLEFLQVYSIKAGWLLTRVSSRMSHLGKEGSFGDSSYVQQLFQIIWNLLSTSNQGPISLLKRLLSSDPVKVILKLPWKIIFNLPGFSILKRPVEYIFFSQKKEESNPENGNSNSNSNIIKPPLIEEIAIPSVSKLYKSGVRFLPANGSISSITFDAKMATLYLPTVSLDVNTEVTLRNLVAYEASNASGPLVMTRYTELMNGIIDTEEDAKILRERGIILNRLKSDEEVANLWNGMSKSIRLTKVPFLDKVIEDVNNYHTGIWKVKAGKFMKRYVIGSWQLLTFVATVLIFLLMTLQAFCSVYNCPRMFRVTTDL
ncbi:unnamed protein product, partial [Vitis vinifera]